MKFIHLSDIHFCRERAKDVFLSLATLQDYIDRNPVDLIAIAGDIFDSAVMNSGSTDFPEFIEAIKKLGNAAPLAMVYGTPSHDVDKSLEIFKSVDSRYGITILEPGQEYFLNKKDGACSITTEFSKEMSEAVLFGIPEPRKKYLLANNTAGKDETEDAIRGAMRKMCFLLAAKRREYKDTPCVLLYHGEVAGTLYQNGTTIERGTGISITISDLADISADYYALGHIHQPQQVGNLNAYYAGSVYPKNFGETHKASFKVVDIETNFDFTRSLSVNTVDFPHPQNLKIERKWEKEPAAEPSAEIDIREKRVWLELTCAKEDRAFLNADEILEKLYKCGAVEGSRVTLNDIPIETVRAAEITEVTTPEKKFEIWAENSSVELQEGMTQKITALSRDISSGAAKPEGEWELVSLRLRGAIGIKKGIHKDEIAVNFDDYDKGVIALVGANGKGKTTLIENCHPYPQLLTRNKGTLRDHFFLRDSFREIIYRNRANGAMRKFLIQIDGQNKSGSCKYFSFTKTAGLTGDDWQAVDGVDGNLKPYTEDLLNVFGPIELFQRTAFISQRPTKDAPDLTDATAGEKKSLFVALSGIDYLQYFSDKALEKSKELAAAIHDSEIRLQMLEGAVSRKDSERQKLTESETRLKSENESLAEVIAQGQNAKASVENLQAKWNAEEERARKEADARVALDTVRMEISRLSNEAEDYQSAAQNKTSYEAKIGEYEALQKTIEGEKAKQQKTADTNLENSRLYQAEKAAFDEKVRVLEIERGKLCDKRNGLERVILNANAHVNLYEKEAAEIKDACPTCGQKLPEAKIAELKERREVVLTKIGNIKADIAKHKAEVNDTDKSIEGVEQQLSALQAEAPKPLSLAQFDNTTLQAAEAKLRQIAIAEARGALTKAQEAAVRIEGLQRQIADKKQTLSEKEALLKTLLPIFDGEGQKIRADLDAALKLHADLTERYTETKASIARSEECIKAVQATLAEIEAQEQEIKTVSSAIAESKTEAAQWDIIARGFGKDGIQALELDALAPGISETANRILSAAYGDRFRIEIQTTRIGGAGKKTKQIEDFLIYVTDNADEGAAGLQSAAVLLDNKSGGEAVWIKRAIYDAFAVIRKRNTAFAFLSCFQDETDGALDSESKTAYCRMIEAAHAESNLRHTIIITHSNEVKAMIEQKIDMEELEAK